MTLDRDAQALIKLTVAHQKRPSDDLVRQIVDILRKKGDFIQIARWLTLQNDLRTYSPDWLLELHRKFPIRYLALGGGADFLYPLWQNFDGREGPLNPDPFSFGPDMVLPVKSRTRELVYIHDALDDNDEATAGRLLTEAARIVTKAGALIVTSKVDAESATTKVSGCGLSVVSSDRSRIADRFSFVPRIRKAAASRNIVFAVHRPGA